MAGKYGLIVNNNSGTTILNTSDIVGRIRYNIVASPDSSGATTLSDISGKTTYPFSIPTDSDTLAHDVGISGTTFSWTFKSSTYVTSGSSLVGVILID